MTVSSAIATATLAWTGVETAFTPGFQAQSPDDVSVVYASATLTQTLALGVNYALSLDGAGFVTVTPIALPAAPASLTISRNSTLLQADSFADGEPWSAETIGQALDLCALRDQELRRDVKGSTTFAGLLDVEITEGPAIDGFVPAWNNATQKWNAVASGGGGGGGSGYVTSLAALAATNPSAAIAYLALAGKSGLFLWVAGNRAAIVAKDPAKAVNVAWSGDSSPGASGAWVRQFDGMANFLWFDAKGDGVNTAAAGFINIPTNPTAGQTIQLNGPFGTILTAVASGATGNQFNILSTPALTVAALLASLQASGDSNIALCTWALGSPATTIIPTYGSVGTNGNSFAMSTNITGATVSATLSGGAISGFDNSSAWNGFQSWASTQTTGVSLLVQPGVYNFDHSLCQGYLTNIPVLAVYGYGADFLNTYNGGANFGFQLPWGWAAQPQLFPANAALIATTTAQQQSVTCLTPAQAASITKGMSVMVGSLDIEYFGYPPNLDLFDFVTVTSVDVPNGTVNFKENLRNAHRADYPDGPNVNGCGKARIYFGLDRPNIPWNVQHTYYGLTVLQGPSQPTQPYFQQTGRSITFIDCNLPAISPSIAKQVSFKRCNFTSSLPNEPDKLVDRIDFDECTSIGLLNFQSSSINLVKAKGCKFENFGAGNAKFVDIDTCNIMFFSTGQNYGMGRSCTIRDSLIYSASIPTAASGGLPFTIDGSTITYANGVFTITNASGWLTETLTPIPGMTIGLSDSTYGFSADRSVGIITEVADSGSSVIIKTTLPYATLSAGTPSWFSGQFYINHAPVTRVYNSSGCDVIRQLSEATAADFYPGNYYRNVFFGKPAKFPVFQYKGELTEIDFNVIQASTAGGPTTFSLTQFGAPAYPAFTGPLQYQITVDLTIVGKRTWTLAALTGKVGSDAVLLNGSAQTALPAVWINGGLFGGFNSDPTTTLPSQNGIFEMIMKFDTGNMAKLIPAQFDQSGPALNVAGIIGQLP